VWIYTSTPPVRIHGVVLILNKSTGTTLPSPFMYENSKSESNSEN